MYTVFCIPYIVNVSCFFGIVKSDIIFFGKNIRTLRCELFVTEEYGVVRSCTEGGRKNANVSDLKL